MVVFVCENEYSGQSAGHTYFYCVLVDGCPCTMRKNDKSIACSTRPFYTDKIPHISPLEIGTALAKTQITVLLRSLFPTTAIVPYFSYGDFTRSRPDRAVLQYEDGTIVQN